MPSTCHASLCSRRLRSLAYADSVIGFRFLLCLAISSSQQKYLRFVVYAVTVARSDVVGFRHRLLRVIRAILAGANEEDWTGGPR